MNKSNQCWSKRRSFQVAGRSRAPYSWPLTFLAMKNITITLFSIKIKRLKMLFINYDAWPIGCSTIALKIPAPGCGCKVAPKHRLNIVRNESAEVILPVKQKTHTMGSEFDEQVRIVKWARFLEVKYPELKLLNASANGVHLTKAQAGKAKAAGMVPGWPDLNLPVARGGFNGLYIELKVGRRKPKAHQVEILKALADQDHCCLAAWGADAAIRKIKEYLEGQIVKGAE